MITYQTDVQNVPVPKVDHYGGYLIGTMEAAGATVILRDTGREFMVKIREKGRRQIRTGSTSGYPLKHAFELWIARKETTNE